MTTFELNDVRAFADELDADIARCESGEGLECTSLEMVLEYYAGLCCKYVDAVRAWGRAVFAGRVAFDNEAERILRAEGQRLYSQAAEMTAYSRQAERECYELEGCRRLEAALWHMQGLLENWVTPKLAVGPTARQGLPLGPAEAEEARRRIAALPPLPADWEPTDPRLRAMHRKLRNA